MQIGIILYKRNKLFLLYKICSLYILILFQTILKYIENNSTCYLISLDAEKAFDKLWRPGIFYKLIERLNSQDWVILKQYYDISRACIVNNDEKQSYLK